MDAVEVGRRRRRRVIAQIAAVLLFPIIIGLVALAVTNRGELGDVPTLKGKGTAAVAAVEVAPAPPPPPPPAPKPIDAAPPAKLVDAAPPPPPPPPTTEDVEFVFPASFSRGRGFPRGLPKAVIDKFVADVKTCDGRIEILGHTDASGSERKNLLLGMRRADHVRDLLVKAQADPARLFTSTAGPRVPAEGSADSPDGAIDRRVTVRCTRKL